LRQHRDGGLDFGYRGCARAFLRMEVIERIDARRQCRAQPGNFESGGDEVAPEVVTLGLGHRRIEFAAMAGLSL